MTPLTQAEKSLANSLANTTRILNECSADYRIIGSVLIAAYTNRIFRRIGDLDIVLDKKSKDTVFDRLKREGFIFQQRRWGFFSWYEVSKEDHLGLSILLIGDFYPKYFTYRFLKIFELRITDQYMQPTDYQFCGVTFTGIPISSVIAGIKQSFLNPKRKIDNEVLSKVKLNMKTTIHNQINVYFLGVKIPYLYDTFSFFYNIYGGIRVMFGKKYEMW